ncbi:hypothetical protein ABZ319_04470 [Nocardia sp. NPDC005978]|uniref:hypothetical protein n=1 Tax=Nocardia sp. NPDC005978 TaxID=3156725 RepID=UPI0033B09043
MSESEAVPEKTVLAKAGDEESAQEGVEDAESLASQPDQAEVESEAEPRRKRAFPWTVAALGRTGRVAALAAVALTLVTSVGSSVFLYQRNEHHKDLLAAHEAAREAACKYAPVLVTYDAKHLDAYFAAVLDGATGDWRKQFDSTSKDLREVLVQGEVTAKADDVQCAIRTGDENSAEAVVVIGQTITSLGTKGQPAPGQLSMILWLERSGDKWMVNKVNSPLAQLPQS